VERFVSRFDGEHSGDRAFNPRRLTFARERRGLTKSKLALVLKVDLRSISAWESGEFQPSTSSVESLAAQLRFPLEFFFGDDIDRISAEAASFRSMAKMTAAQRDMALTQGALARVLAAWLDSRFELPAADVPDLSQESDPEAAAESLRIMWGLGQLSIRNMVHLLEAKGVRVFSLGIDTREVDAFSTWKGSTPFVFLNNFKTSERSRFDAAHELGHLVLHRHSSPNGREAEREADRFAAAFLMPRGSVIAESPRIITLASIIRLKAIWKVSVAALNHRLHEVGLLTDWNYRNLCIQIAKHGYHTKEPEGIPRETSLLLPELLEHLRNEDGVRRTDIARALGIYAAELDQVLFGLVMAGIEGGRQGQGTGNRADLQRVK